MIDKLIAEIRKIAAERPDVTYPGRPCFYDSGECSDGSVGCLIGQALANIGWGIYTGVPDKSIADLLNCHCPEAPDNLVKWCLKVQFNQDNGGHWAEAVELADST